MTPAIYRHHFWVERTEAEWLKSHFQLLLKNSGFQILNFMEHHFEPHGYTAIWLLGESHLAIHTFPEKKMTYIELASCNLEMYERFLNQL